MRADYHHHHLVLVLQGFGLIIPPRLLPLFTSQELEYLVCGEPLDISKLESSVQYHGCKATDELIRNLWTIVKEDFTDAER